MHKQEFIWIVDDDQSIRWVLEKSLSKASLSTQSFVNASDCLVMLKKTKNAAELPSLIISDIRMEGLDGLSLLEQVNEKHPTIPVVIITAHSDLKSAVDAYENGAFEYLPKPFDLDEVLTIVQRALEKGRKHQKQLSGSEVGAKTTNSRAIIGEAPAMQAVYRTIGRLSKSHVSVLINGESGTGKELVAHALHRHSPRNKEPFIALNMAAIPPDLIESELFGHEKGAFTGANSQHKGRFEQAHKGTLFLDEIGDMPPSAQTRLLRVLSEGEFYRVGGHTSVKVDVRILTATHQNLELLCKEQRFREDLFHRLNVIRIHLPKLQDRCEDIPELADYFLNKSSTELNLEAKRLMPETLAKLMILPWPGNVRQLQNLCHWLVAMAPGPEIHLTDLPEDLTPSNVAVEPEVKDWPQMLKHWAKALINSNPDLEILSVATPLFEKTLIDVALKQTNGRKNDAAKLLGWGRNTLTRKFQEYSLSSKDH